LRINQVLKIFAQAGFELMLAQRNSDGVFKLTVTNRFQ